MYAFDLRTVVFLTSGMGMLLSLVLFFLRKSYPPSIRGMGHWALGPLLAGLSSLLFGLQGLVPIHLVLVPANLVLLAGSDLMVEGTFRHFGLARPRWTRLLPILGIGLPAMLWWSLVTPSYGMRTLVISGLLGGYFLSMAWVLFRHARSHFAGRFTLLVSLVMGLVTLLRMATATQVPVGQGLFDSTFFQNLYILGMCIGLLMLSIGFVLLAAKALQSELENLATHDSLTGALTRRALFSQGEVELARASRTGEPMSVLMMDLDHFKQVNDTHGHLVGDAVLRDFALRVEAQRRQTDLFGRYGGEEFVLLLPNTDAAQSQVVAQRILDSRSADPRLPLCTVSIGVATHQRSDDGQTLETLINQADQALYQAKGQGRNRIEIARP